MAIDHETKWITVEKMAELLRQLCPRDELYPVGTGNLAIFRDGEYVGFIDVAGESVDLY
jgi:hypothetical protein